MRFSPLFAKEGKGRFSDGMTRELCRELLGQGTRSLALIADDPGETWVHWIIYDLATATKLKARATKQQLLEAIKGHSSAEGELVGRYKR